ncbi:hypothetical protein, partial [Phocaeicola dorei]|uniref:hypothetical protein n=1 Tax=Phocaeicola dorei TaxID=357276 RepID=UPI001D09403A
TNSISSKAFDFSFILLGIFLLLSDQFINKFTHVWLLSDKINQINIQSNSIDLTFRNRFVSAITSFGLFILFHNDSLIYVIIRLKWL